MKTGIHPAVNIAVAVTFLPKRCSRTYAKSAKRVDSLSPQSCCAKKGSNCAHVRSFHFLDFRRNCADEGLSLSLSPGGKAGLHDLGRTYFPKLLAQAPPLSLVQLHCASLSLSLSAGSSSQRASSCYFPGERSMTHLLEEKNT